MAVKNGMCWVAVRDWERILVHHCRLPCCGCTRWSSVAVSSAFSAAKNN